MATRRYVVVGQNSSPTEFEEYVYAQLQRRELLTLTATEVQDDLARKRSPALPQEFTFQVRSLHAYGDFYLEVTDDAQHWIRIDTDPQVIFTIFD